MRTMLGAGAGILLVAGVIAAAGFSREDGRATPLVSSSQPTSAPASRPAADPDTGLLPREGAFAPKPVFERFFTVSIDGVRVGHASMMVEEWHHGLTLVTRFEQHWFPTPGKDRTHAYWEIQKHSETQGRPNAWWGSGQDRTRAFNFRLEGGGRRGSVERNWLGLAGVKESCEIPRGYFLIQELAKKLGRVVPAGERIELPVLNYHPLKPAWTERVFVYEGEDQVAEVGGASQKANRYRYTDAAYPGDHVLLWVDEQGYPLAKRVPCLRMEVTVCDKATAEKVVKEIGPDEAKERWRLGEKPWLVEALYDAFAEPGKVAEKAADSTPSSQPTSAPTSMPGTPTTQPDGSAPPAKRPFPETLLINFGL